MRGTTGAVALAARRLAPALLIFSALFAMQGTPLAAEGEGGDAKSGEAPRTLGQALAEGAYGIDLYYRFEEVSDDAPMFDDKNGRASTLRTALRYRSADYRHFWLLFEVEDVSDIGFEDQHANGGAGSLSNGVADRPTIADPASTEVNQALIGFGGLPDTGMMLGRRATNLGQQRFIGSVPWRQNHQTLDGFFVEQGSIPRTKLQLGYFDNVNRINGSDADLHGYIFNAEIDAGGSHRVTTYFYGLDFDDDLLGVATNTFGARWQNTFTPGDGISVPVHLELAEQRDTGDNPSEVDAGYLRAEAKVRWSGIEGGIGYELLEGEAGAGAFSTPLATLHKWNGWADQFLSTPADGLEDLYFMFSVPLGSAKGTLILHDFSADSTGADYGHEIDALVTWEARWGQSFGFKMARYEADEFRDDKTIFWLFSGYKFGGRVKSGS